MATKNTIQVFLLDNKSIQTKINGYPYSYEGAYNIVAGDDNATEFEIASVPSKYAEFTITVAMTNSRGQTVLAPPIVDNKFTLPIGMAVAGYGQIVFSAHGIDDDGNSVTANFLPLKIKVANTDANWTSGVISGTITIGSVKTLQPNEPAYVINVGTSTDAVLNIGIPEGKGFLVDKTYPSVEAMNEGYATDGVRMYGFVIIETGDVEDEDNAKLFIKTETGYRFLVDMSGAQGIRGKDGNSIIHVETGQVENDNGWTSTPIIISYSDPDFDDTTLYIQAKNGQDGDPGTGISEINPDGQDANGGNKYKIVLTDGNNYTIVAPKGANGDIGNGISSTVVTYAASTSGTTAPTTGWTSSIPAVTKGSYLWTRTVFNYDDGTSKTVYSSAYQGKDGENFNSSGTYPDLTAGSASSATELETARTIDGVNFDGTTNVTHFGTCSSSSTTQTKIVNIPNFVLVVGAKIAVKFSYTNDVNAPRLNVNSTGAIVIRSSRYNDSLYSFEWEPENIVEFIYDGSYWVPIGSSPLLAHPVNSVFISVNGVSPASIFGGKWVKIDADYYLKSVNSELGEAPGTYKEAGLPNIEGFFNAAMYEDSDASGPFALSNARNITLGTSGGSRLKKVTFNSSQYNAIYGASDTVTPAHLTVYMWRRIA